MGLRMTMIELANVPCILKIELPIHTWKKSASYLGLGMGIQAHQNIVKTGQSVQIVLWAWSLAALFPARNFLCSVQYYVHERYYSWFPTLKQPSLHHGPCFLLLACGHSKWQYQQSPEVLLIWISSSLPLSPANNHETMLLLSIASQDTTSKQEE